MSHTILFSFSQFSSVQSLDRLGRWGDMRDDSAETLFRSFLQEAIVRLLAWEGCPLFDVVSQAFPLQPRRRPPSKAPCGARHARTI